ncbi:hypothetical protein Pmar_PMAR029072 [Perkinsus marinus ATCC 50983]|uniref:Uncharacterized protein n=1 Tax=Perkinsus marinus (strain ATCC 50983 / TXsc) TaxID=423536 RepID=C5LFT2_PERM5|nr:hypothetical protein Pmar_PMAR029072 [Perkinsus marinus ATCC 50983]EER04411.1 hypothetical protein Pmar_PMAR029072 [Perkinsus marinus ATCC 50983]|eukprot:XP_002772595.1 hypothetical protein Pmar_PMAR029072 [Perkinsus marinus ATCC 50983]
MAGTPTHTETEDNDTHEAPPPAERRSGERGQAPAFISGTRRGRRTVRHSQKNVSRARHLLILNRRFDCIYVSIVAIDISVSVLLEDLAIDLAIGLAHLSPH